MDGDALLGLAKALFAILGDRRNPRRAGDAAAHALASLDRLLADAPSPVPLACAKGCSTCCHNWVAATAPEIFLIARSLRDDAAALRRVRAGALRTAGLDRARRVAGGEACALLDGDLCGAYAVRPLVCRAYVSASLAACLAAFRGGPQRIPMPAHFFTLRAAHDQALWAALQAAGLSDASYELNAAIDRVLAGEDAEARWLAGEDVFAGIARDEPEEEAAAAFTGELAAVLLSAAPG